MKPGYKLQETRGDHGWYHTCSNQQCFPVLATIGNSNAPGYFSVTEDPRCRSCGRKPITTFICRPHELRIIRLADGLVAFRYADTKNGRIAASKRMQRLNTHR